MTSLEFAEAARQMGSVIRRAGHVVPTFRSPPRVPGRSRSIVRRADGSATVAVALRGRAITSIVADMIDGVIAANRLHGQEAAWLRDQLWASVEAVLDPGSEGPERALRVSLAKPEVRAWAA